MEKIEMSLLDKPALYTTGELTKNSVAIQVIKSLMVWHCNTKNAQDKE